jgi:hypothetical protein
MEVITDVNVRWTESAQRTEVNSPPSSSAETDSSTADTKNNPMLCTGQTIRVVGLKAHPELNGRQGLVVDFHDFHEGEGRWRVHMDDGVGKIIRSTNLEVFSGMDVDTNSHRMFAIGQPIHVVGLMERPELNGKRGTVIDFHEGDGRWKVRLDDGTGKMLKPTNMEMASQRAADRNKFVAGQRVRVIGLEERTELNGQEGVVVAFDESESRWKVRLNSRTGKMLRAANLEHAQSLTKLDEPSWSNQPHASGNRSVEIQWKTCSAEARVPKLQSPSSFYAASQGLGDERTAEGGAARSCSVR